MANLILIDFSWLYNKYFYVAKFNNMESLNPIEPTLTTMLYQFLSLVHKSSPGSKVIIALDSPTSSLSNTKIYKDYKQNRDKEGKKEVYKCLDKVLAFLLTNLDSSFFFFAKAPNYEADQIIAHYTKKFHESRSIIIFSGDKDLLQLTHYSNVKVSDKFEKGKFLVKTDAEIFSKFKNNKGEDFTRISSNKRDILKYRVLKGDTSDNLSSVFPRIRDTEIKDIIQNYWIDEEDLTNERISDILDDLKGFNSSLAEKLEANRDIWLRNFKIMNLYNVDNIQVKRIKHIKVNK